MMLAFRSHNHVLWLFFGILALTGWSSAAWGLHADIPCETCHHKSEAELKDYTYDSADFPISDLCLSCHEQLYGDLNAHGAKGWRRHPVGVTIYGAKGTNFESWYRLQNKVTQAQFPSGNRADLFRAEVFCLTCHRAHASTFKDAMRWDYSKTAQGCLECHAF